MNRSDLFNVIRSIKGSALTQSDVDRVNHVLDGKVGLKPSQKCIDLIHSFESFQAKAYKDPGSKDGLPITIGWGSTSDISGRPIKLGDVWTKTQADVKFAQDLESFGRQVLAAAETATQSQYDAMVSFAYNVGIAAFRSSTLLKKHKAGDFRGAQAEFARWNKNDGRVMAGLTRRRASEAALYAS